MPRALTVVEVRVAPGERDAFLAAAGARRRSVSDGGAHHWLFEDQARPGTFLEFVEARDAATLARLRPAGGEHPPILTEVELP